MPDAAAAGLKPLYTVVYDGDCRVCTRFARALRKWHGHERVVQIVPSQAPGVMARFPWISASAFAEALQLIGPNDETWAGSRAIEKLLDVLPRGRWIAWIFRVPFARRIADRSYRWVAWNRCRFGCGDHCSP